MRRKTRILISKSVIGIGMKLLYLGIALQEGNKNAITSTGYHNTLFPKINPKEN